MERLCDFPKVVCMCAQSCPAPCDYMDHSPPGSSVHRILQARILEWVSIPSSKGSSWPRDSTCVSCIGRRILYNWATGESPFPKVTQLIIGRGRIQIQAIWFQSKEPTSCAINNKHLELMYICSIYLESLLCHVCKVSFFSHWPHVSGISFQDILIFKDSFNVWLNLHVEKGLWRETVGGASVLCQRQPLLSSSPRFMILLTMSLLVFFYSYVNF